MIEYYGENPAANQNPWAALFKTVAILRIGAGVMLLSRHGVRMIMDAYQFLWKEQPWELARQFTDAGVPWSHLTTPAAALLVAAVGLSWSLGFLTRFFALLFLPFIISVIVLLEKSGSLQDEAAWLYGFISITLLLFGSGAVSLDKLFHIGGQLVQPRRGR